MAMTLRLTDEERDALRDLADAEGVSMQDVARRAIRQYTERAARRGEFVAAAERVLTKHAAALERLGR
jgi:predicted transcriptional regulator